MRFIVADIPILAYESSMLQDHRVCKKSKGRVRLSVESFLIHMSARFVCSMW